MEMEMKKIISIFIILSLILLPVFSYINHPPKYTAIVAEIQLNMSAKIFNINGDTQLGSAASSGNGSIVNPYIIEDLVINAGGSPNFAIYIESTTAYFILRNCTASNSEQAITLDNVINGRIENCTAKNSNYGILLQFSNNCTVHNSSVYNIIRNGVYLYGSNIASVTSNGISGCGWSGIAAYMGGGHNLSWNVLYNAGDAIDIDNSHSNTLLHNTISAGNYGAYVHSSNYNRLRENTATGNAIGIKISTSSTNTVLIDNNASNNLWGIWLEYSDSNTLFNNTANYNDYHGFSLTSTSFQNLTFNTANHNGDYGFYLKSNNGINFTNNQASFNNDTGLCLDNCDLSNFTGNTINRNYQNGIYLDYSDSNTIEWNTLWYNFNAINLTSTCSLNTIQNNDIRDLVTISEGDVSPKKGTESTVFFYTVKYTHADNIFPDSIVVFIDFTPHTLLKQTPSDIDCTDGCIYTFNTTLINTPHSYHYEATVGGLTLRLPPYGEIIGPNVSEKIPGFIWILNIFSIIAILSLIILYNKHKKADL